MEGIDAGLRLSLVVLNYRTGEQTAAAVRNACASASTIQVEAIVVDNASGDNSVEVLRRMSPGASIVELASNMGFAAGMNVGIRAAGGDYVLLLNSDVEALPGAVEAMVGFMRANPGVGLCAPLLVDEHGRNSRTLLLQPTLARLLIPLVGKAHYRKWRDRIGVEPLDVEATEGAAVIVSRRALEKAGLLDEDFFFYNEIVEWCMRVRASGFRVVVLPGAKMVHACGGSTGEVRRAARIELKRSEYQLVAKALGPVACPAVLARDFLSEVMRVAFYGLLAVFTVGSVRRVRHKLAVHGGVLAWLALGRPPRGKSVYRRLFGKWD